MFTAVSNLNETVHIVKKRDQTNQQKNLFSLPARKAKTALERKEREHYFHNWSSPTCSHSPYYGVMISMHRNRTLWKQNASALFSSLSLSQSARAGHSRHATRTAWVREKKESGRREFLGREECATKIQGGPGSSVGQWEGTY